MKLRPYGRISVGMMRQAEDARGALSLGPPPVTYHLQIKAIKQYKPGRRNDYRIGIGVTATFRSRHMHHRRESINDEATASDDAYPYRYSPVTAQQKPVR